MADEKITDEKIWFTDQQVKSALSGSLPEGLKPDDIVIARKSDVDMIKEILKDAYVLSEATTRAIASIFAFITVPRPPPPPPNEKWLGRKITLPGYDPMSRSKAK